MLWRGYYRHVYLFTYTRRHTSLYVLLYASGEESAKNGGVGSIRIRTLLRITPYTELYVPRYSVRVTKRFFRLLLSDAMCVNACAPFARLSAFSFVAKHPLQTRRPAPRHQQNCRPVLAPWGVGWTSIRTCTYKYLVFIPVPRLTRARIRAAVIAAEVSILALGGRARVSHI